jgi:hypothetical protein
VSIRNVGSVAQPWFWAAAVLLVVPALVAEFRSPLNSDAAWLLYAAGAVLRGGRLYHDILEINPPLIIWLNLPPAFISRISGLGGPAVFRIWMLCLICASTWACLRLFRHLPRSDDTRGVAGLTLLFVLLPLVGGIFGQREHLALALILPLVVLTAVRVHGETITTSAAVITGATAAVGIAIKPYFLVVWLLLLAYRSLRMATNRLKTQPEDWAIIAVGISYVVSVLILTPGFFVFAMPAAADYAQFGRHGLFYILFGDTPAIWFYIAVVLWVLLGRSARADPFAGAFVAAGWGFLASVAVQHKGWSYHYYPVSACAILLAVYSITLAGARWQTDRPASARLLWRSVVGVYAVLIGIFVVKTMGEVARRAGGELWERQSAEVKLRSAVSRVDGVRSLLVLSSQLRDAFPLVNDTRLEWCGSFPVMWIPLVKYRSYAGLSDRTSLRSPREMDALERQAFARVIADLVQGAPDLLLVESRKLNERRTQFPEGFDYLGYFGQDKRFGAAMKNYRPLGEVEGLSILQRAVGVDGPDRSASCPARTPPSRAN